MAFILSALAASDLTSSNGLKRSYDGARLSDDSRFDEQSNTILESLKATRCIAQMA